MMDPEAANKLSASVFIMMRLTKSCRKVLDGHMFW